MEEEGGEEDTDHGERENDKRIDDGIIEIRPHTPDHTVDRADYQIEPSKPLTEHYP